MQDTLVRTLVRDDLLRAADAISSRFADTPLERSDVLSQRYGVEIYLKREDLQVTGSYKIRGAYNAIQAYRSSGSVSEIVCASAGNHAQGVAYACRALGMHATIFMPETTPEIKVRKTREYGTATVRVSLCGKTFDEAEALARSYSERTSGTYVHPFDDRYVIAGQSTIGAELLRQSTVPIDSVYAPIGGGWLVSGIISSFACQPKAERPKIVWVQSFGAQGMRLSLVSGRIVPLRTVDTMIDGAAVKAIGQKAFGICSEYGLGVSLVSNAEVLDAAMELWSLWIQAELAGAMWLAAVRSAWSSLHGKTVVLIVSGGNISSARQSELARHADRIKGQSRFDISFPDPSMVFRK